MVNAWSTGVGLALGQVQTDKKSNEITAIPELLEKLDIKGTIISMDAMGCQVKIAKIIREKVADYLLALKGNQSSLEEKVKSKFLEISKPGPKTFTVDEFTSVDENSHGRHETRSCRVIQAKENKNLGVNVFYKWPDLNSLIEIKSQRVDRKTGLVGEEAHYYISSAIESAEYFLKSVRNHWQVESVPQKHKHINKGGLLIKYVHRSYIYDEGGPFGYGLQRRFPNHFKLLHLRGVVVSVEVKASVVNAEQV